jgi:sugar lactone lactonase YvrE/predicted ester cyclase
MTTLDSATTHCRGCSGTTERARALRAPALAALLLVHGCGEPPPPSPEPPAREAPPADASIARAVADAFNAGDPAKLDALMAADLTRHGPPGPPIEIPGTPRGLDLVKAEWQALRAAFPDARMTVETALAGGDQVSAHYTITGTHGGPYYGVPPAGAQATLRAAATYRLDGGRVVEMWIVADPLNTLQALTMPVPAPAPAAALPAEELAHFAPGTFLESIALDARGRIFISSMFDGEILAVDANGQSEVFARVDFGPRESYYRGVVCLAFDQEGGLNAVVSSSDPAVHGVWRFEPDGAGARRAALPPHAAPNGIAVDGNGNLYVADSVHGIIWRIGRDDAEASAWLANPLLAPRPYLGGTIPGANGIKVFGDAVYTVVSDTGRFVKVPILEDGRPGLPQVVAERFPGDDFAFDVAGNVYMTTHPYNTVIRLAPDGARAVVASVAQGVVGPTSVAFGTAPADLATLYVLNDGGLAAPLADRELRPNIVRLATDVAGHPLVRPPD